MPLSVRTVRNTRLVKQASLSVRTARGLPYFPIARNKCPSNVHEHLFGSAAKLSKARLP